MIALQPKNNWPTQNAQPLLESNWKDWCKGGPDPAGWTRTGSRFNVPCPTLDYYTRSEIDVKEALAKNIHEVMRWHVEFLIGNRTLDETQYFHEYLAPRYSFMGALRRAQDFLALFQDIQTNGVQVPVQVVDLGNEDLGFRYFRFDGCHRLACALSLGISKVPALIFTVKQP